MSRVCTIRYFASKICYFIAFAKCNLGACDLEIEMLLIVEKKTREINGKWNLWQLSATKKL